MTISTQTQSHIIDNSIFRVGQVVEIVGQEVKVKVDTGKNTSSLLYKGEVIQNISVGGYIKINKGFDTMIGKIEGESVKEGKEGNSSYSSNKEKIHRILSIKILGFMEDGRFKRGIKELPLIDNTCYLLTKEQFNEIHNFVAKDDEPIHVGVLEYDDGQTISLGVNKLFASHIGIFGNTGSGKSYTLAKIYREVFKKYKDNDNFKRNAEFFLIDFNGEYIGKYNNSLNDYESRDVIIEGQYKNVYELTTRKQVDDIGADEKFPIHQSTLKDITFWSIFLEATEKTQTPFLNRAIKDTYIESRLDSDASFKALVQEKIFQAVTQIDKKTEKSVITDFLSELANYFSGNSSIKEAEKYFRANYGLFLRDGKSVFKWGDYYSDNSNHIEFFRTNINQNIANISDINISNLSQIKKFGLTIIIKYYDEMIRGFSNQEHLSPLIKRLDKRIVDIEKVLSVKSGQDNNSRKNLTIVSLRNVNLDIRKMIPMLLAKELYDEKKKDPNKNRSLHIIVDEAHNILSHISDRESSEWKDYRLETFEEIIKEGRKFGTFLTIASQRPSDISPTIISQLHNYFLHRLINNNDLKAVERTISYLDKVSADSIPNLATGTCILAGIIAQIPVVLKVGSIESEQFEPQSQNVNLLRNWE